MKDVMIDFETFGNGTNACVMQIGACYFDRDSGETGKEFKTNIDARTCVKNGAQIDADTVYWWLSQSKEAIASITANPKLDENSAFNSLNEFLSDAESIWSHATFDFVILTETLKRLGIKMKFHYRTARDIRTLMDLSDIEKIGVVREGIHHDALDDAKFQVRYCVLAMKSLKDRD